MSKKQETVTVIGAGTIGLSWSALFSAHGHKVRLNDVRENFQEAVKPHLCAMIADINSDVDAVMKRVSFHSSLDEALDGATMVQENGPEKPDFKQAMFAELESKVAADTMLVSSSSGIPPNVSGEKMKAPGRVLIGHPLNPPHLMPLVEICTTDTADEATVERLIAFYKSTGRVPVRLNKPIPGFVVNRLQTALVREAIHIIEEGVVDVGDMDKIMLNSLGIRYAAIGPMLTGQLGGGAGGLKEMIDKILSTLITALDLPAVDAKTLALLDKQAAKYYPLEKIDDFAAVRDARQLAVIDIQAKNPLPGEN